MSACSNHRMSQSRICPLRLILLAMLALFCLRPVAARAHQESPPVSKAVEEFLKIQTQGLPGQARFKVTPLDPRNNLAPCPAFMVELTPGARLWGRSSVRVRCQAEGGWMIHVPVQILVTGHYLVTARALTRGQAVTEADLSQLSGELTMLPDGILTEPDQAIGRSASLSIPAGRPLRGDMLQQAWVIQQGQTVQVVSSGAGFQVTAGDGRALGNATEGQIVQVRMANGRLISGLARGGATVEVGY